MIEYNHTCVSQRSSQKLRPPGTISSWHFLSIFITCNIIDVWISLWIPMSWTEIKDSCYKKDTKFCLSWVITHLARVCILHFEFTMGPDRLFSFYTYDFTTFSTLLERWTDRKFRKYIPSLILQINIRSIQWKCLMFTITSVCATPKIQTFHGIENSTDKKSE